MLVPQQGFPVGRYGGPAAAAAVTMPHPILFLENPPQDATTDDIAAVFKVVCSRLKKRHLLVPFVAFFCRFCHFLSSLLLLSSSESSDTIVDEP